MTNPHPPSEPDWPVDDSQTRDDRQGQLDPAPLYGPRFQENPAEVYAELRRQHGSVAPALLEGGLTGWIVLGYRELQYVLSNDQLFARDSRRWNQRDRIPPDWGPGPGVHYRPCVLFTEGAEHRRRTGAISDALMGVDEFELRSETERIADKVIDAFIGAGAADLMSEYAHPVTMLVMSKVFGMSEAESSAMLTDLAASTSSVEGGNRAVETVTGKVRMLVERARRNPGPDVPSRMLARSEGLSEEELVNDLTVVLGAAHQPTVDWIGNTFRLMLTDSRFTISISGGRRSIGQALNEVLWEDSPSQAHIGRWASRNTQLGGQQIKAGDLLILGIAAANTDPQVRPDFYNGAMGNHAQMSFGHGEHRCPYPAPDLAEVIAKAAVEVLLDRLPDVTIAVSPGALVWTPSVYLRGLSALPVTFTPAYVG